jgi:hypothetical protein
MQRKSLCRRKGSNQILMSLVIIAASHGSELGDWLPVGLGGRLF